MTHVTRHKLPPFCVDQVLIFDWLIVTLVGNDSHQHHCQDLLSFALHSGIGFCTVAKNLYHIKGTHKRMNRKLEVRQCVCKDHFGTCLHCSLVLFQPISHYLHWCKDRLLIHLDPCFQRLEFIVLNKP